MRKITLNPNYFLLQKVTYVQRTRTRTGIGVEVIMESGNKAQFFHPSSWRRFKKWVI